MRIFRHVISDAFCGGPLAAAIGVLMALQALIGGFGTGAMAFAMMQQPVLCSGNGMQGHAGHATDHASHDHSTGMHSAHAGHGSGSGHAAMKLHGHDREPAGDAHKNHRPDCCLTACQVAASVVHFGIHSDAPQPAPLAVGSGVIALATLAAGLSPKQLGLGGDARGPPLLPI